MPGLDGTGPRGKGQMTGRGMGYCVIPVSTQNQELDLLKNRAQALREELERIKTKIRGLEALRAKPTIRSK